MHGFLKGSESFASRRIKLAGVSLISTGNKLRKQSLIVGLCLLIFFQTAAGRLIERVVPFTYTVFGVVLAPEFCA